MFYGFFFLALSVGLGISGLSSEYQSAIFLIWGSIAYLIVAIAYLVRRPSLLGKHRDGTMSIFSRILLLPYFLPLWGIWNLSRRLMMESPFVEVVPGILIGRRLLASEVPEGFQAVIDLTSEFIESRPLRSSAGYMAVPVLDAMPPASDDFLTAVHQISETEGRVFIHCAQGHGRTAMFTSLLLIKSGHATSLDEALSKILAVRPNARPNRRQRDYLQRVVAQVLTPRAH